MPTPTVSERLGTIIGGRYEVRQLLGAGGFSAVFEAVHVVTGRAVALKLMHGHLTEIEAIAERFLVESRAMARIKHEGIAQVLDAGTDPDGTVFIAMELLDGESLEGALQREGRLPWREVTRHCVHVLDALAEAHKHGIIHRDIKPGNIFLARMSDGTSQAKLLDFGIAHVARPDTRITGAGMVLGTPEYMSPEQSRAAALEPASDLWSVGVVMWECLTGRTPFEGNSVTDTLLNVSTLDVPSILTQVPDLPPAFAAVVHRALQRDLRERFHTAVEMRDALLRLTRPTARGSGRFPGLMHPGDERWAAATTDVVHLDAATLNVRVATQRPSTPSDDLSAPRRSYPAGAPTQLDLAEPEPLRPSQPRDSGAPLGSRSSARPAKSPSLRVEPTPEFSTSPSQLTFDEPPPPVPDLSAAERAARSFTGDRATFHQPPSEARARPKGLFAVAAVGALVVGAGIFLATRPGATGPGDAVRESLTDPNASSLLAADALVEAPAVVRPGRALTLSPVVEMALPPGMTGVDMAAEFARHAAASRHAGGTQRVLATCVPGVGGAVVYVHPVAAGALRASPAGLAACAGYDLGVVPDVTADGTDDVVVLGASPGTLLVLDSGTLRGHRSIAVDGARGVATGTQVRLRGEPAVIVFAAPRGHGEATEVLAVGAHSGTVFWRVRGEASLARVGDPEELGLAAGPDANGDGVDDVAAGMGPVVGAAATPTDARCVQLFSGADGRPLWPRPWCRPPGPSRQSVSVGPDVDGDGKADVAVGTDAPPEGESPVTILSGADGTVIRRVASPPGVGSAGFGYPVALGGDLDGDRAPDLASGSRDAVHFFDATTGALRASVRRAGAGGSDLRVLPLPALTVEGAWSVVVASASEGVRVYARHEGDEPRP